MASAWNTLLSLQFIFLLLFSMITIIIHFIMFITIFFSFLFTFFDSLQRYCLIQI